MWPLLSLLSGKCIDQLLHTQAEVACKRHEVPGADGRFAAGHDLAEDPGVDAGLPGQLRRRQLPLVHPRAEHLRRSLKAPHGRSPFRRAAGTEAADRPRPPVFHTRARACGPAKASARQAPAS
mgnify:CR=1 FL=1